MGMTFSIGPELTERQERQRTATYEAAKVLRDAGIECDVTDLWAGEKSPNADSAMITVRVLS